MTSNTTNDIRIMTNAEEIRDCVKRLTDLCEKYEMRGYERYSFDTVLVRTDRLAREIDNLVAENVDAAQADK